MSAIPCGCCGRPVADGFVCPADSFRLDEAIQSISAYHGLAWALEITLTRQDRFGTRNGSRSAEKPVPFNHKASTASGRLLSVLRYWANRVARETGDNRPPSDLAPLATWLRPKVGWLRYHEEGARAHTTILDAVADVRRVIDRPPDLVYAGPCGATPEDADEECLEDLYAFPGASYVSCRCGTVWDVQERRRWLLDAAEDQLATTKEISRALTQYAFTVTESMIRNYEHRGLIARRGTKGRATLFRIGDVLDVATRVVDKPRAAAS